MKYENFKRILNKFSIFDTLLWVICFVMIDEKPFVVIIVLILRLISSEILIRKTLKKYNEKMIEDSLDICSDLLKLRFGNIEQIERLLMELKRIDKQ